jgi:hypothetical protein
MLRAANAQLRKIRAEFRENARFSRIVAHAAYPTQTLRGSQGCYIWSHLKRVQTAALLNFV